MPPGRAGDVALPVLSAIGDAEGSARRGRRIGRRGGEEVVDDDEGDEEGGPEGEPGDGDVEPPETVKKRRRFVRLELPRRRRDSDAVDVRDRLQL